MHRAGGLAGGGGHAGGCHSAGTQVESGAYIRLHQSLQAVVDNASVWLTLVDKRGGIVAWNRAAEQISGYSRGEICRGAWNIWDQALPGRGIPPGV
jgi:PAS domain-containing protein